MPSVRRPPDLGELTGFGGYLILDYKDGKNNIEKTAISALRTHGSSKERR